MKQLRIVLLKVLLLSSSLCFSQSREANVTEYLIIAGTSKDFSALETSAKDLSNKTGIKYDDLGRIYKDSCILYPDSIQDELYRGTYVFRRMESEPISIEMNINGILFTPSETKERPKMIIVAGMFANKNDAKIRLSRVQKYIPTAYILRKEVYMGCMH
jgi:hypothetical protein